MLLDPVVRDADVLVAQGDGVDRGPLGTNTSALMP